MSYFHYSSFKSLSDLTSFVQTLNVDDNLIECGQLHRQELTLFFTSPEKKSRPVNAIDYFVTDQPAKTLLRAYHKQIDLSLNHGLLILESPHLSTLFSYVFKKAAPWDSSLLEISRSLLPDGKAVAIYVNLKDFEAADLPQDITATFYKTPNKQLLSLYCF